MSFEQLRRKYNLPNNTFFCYLQLRSFLRSTLNNSMTLPKLTEMENLIQESGPSKLISAVYSLLISECPKPDLYKSKGKWESDLNTTIEDQLWSELCKDSLSATINARYRLVHYNFLHQLYLTPEKIHKFKPELSDACFRCTIEVGSFLHCTWLCVKVQDFWIDFCSVLTKITRMSLPVDPEFCLLGNLRKIDKTLNKFQKHFLRIALAVARKCIAVSWKSDSPLSITKWYLEMNRCVPLEKITFSLRKRYNTFIEIWQPYLEYVDNVKLKWD